MFVVDGGRHKIDRPRRVDSIKVRGLASTDIAARLWRGVRLIKNRSGECVRHVPEAASAAP
jgi:hypothetical protein